MPGKVLFYVPLLNTYAKWMLHLENYVTVLLPVIWVKWTRLKGLAKYEFKVPSNSLTGLVYFSRDPPSLEDQDHFFNMM